MKNFVLLALFFAYVSVTSLEVESKSLKVNGLYTPKGISTVTPHLSWRLSSSKRGDKQTAYQIQAGTLESKLQSPDLWDTAKVEPGADTQSSTSTKYAGKPLASRSIVYWRVRVWDSHGEPSPWSEISTFEVGLLDSSDWSAKWIGNTKYATGNASLPLFAKHFSVNCSSVSKARLYLLGLGQHAAYINEKPVGDDVLAPGYSNVNKTLIYSTYDVTAALLSGSNAIGVQLAKGMYDAEKGLNGRYMKFTVSPRQLMLLAQLEYTCSNGITNTVTSDTTWKTSLAGPYLETSWYGGEEYDARKEIPNWSSASGNISDWEAASTVTPPSGKLTSAEYPLLTIVDKFPAISVSGPTDGEYVFDFGVNFAGWFSLDIAESQDVRVTMRTAEQLHPNGSIDQSTLGGKIWDGYTSNGKKASYHPTFMYHGFRYLGVNLTYPPSVSDATALVIRASSEPIGTFNSSDSMLNSIHRITDRAIQSNMYSIFTDCPHREKHGWLEQDHLVFEPVARGYDIQAMGQGTTQAMIDAQTPEGLIPDIAPEYQIFCCGYRDDPNWGNTGVIFPYQLYREYGDKEVLERSYDTMKRYVSFLSAKTTTFLLSYGLGDWITFDNRTPKNFTATFGYQQAVETMVQVATVLNETDDASSFQALLQNINDAFQKAFFNESSISYGPGTQACNAFPIHMGIVPAQYQAPVIDSIISSIKENDNHLTVGEIGLPSLFIALQSHGRDDIIYSMVTNPTSPSYAYQVLNGATSLNERWDGVTAGGSLNHFMLGYVDKWIVELSGLKQSNTSVAWDEIEFSPTIVGNMTSAASTHRSVKGLIGASWKIEGEAFKYDITVPVGAVGNVRLVGFQKISEGGVDLTKEDLPNGVLDFKDGNGTFIIKVGSGEYSFNAQ